MRTELLKTEALSALLAGLARKPLPPGLAETLPADDPASPLRALALTAQALRFELPTPPLNAEIYQPPIDRRAILPDRLRRPLLRLLNGKPATDHPAAALAQAFNRLRLRPHPFDLPKLESFVRAHAEELGITAQFWAQESATRSSYFDDEILDPTNWATALPAARVAFLKQQRVADPAAALTLLETAWPQESADLRLRLLEALQTGLNPADAPFLDQAANDRAPRVRALALRLRSRLPGAPGENPALKAILERITRTEAGFIRKRPVLKLDLPATVKEHTTAGWLREAFAEVTFAELAAAFSLEETELIVAAEKDPNLLLACALMATTDARPELLKPITDHLPNAFELLYQTGVHTLDPMPYEARLIWATELLRPYSRRLPTSYLVYGWLHRMLQGPAPNTLFDIILSGSWLADLTDLEKQGPQWTELLAALCPPPRYAELRQRLETLDTTYTPHALTLLDILIAMETTNA